MTTPRYTWRHPLALSGFAVLVALVVAVLWIVELWATVAPAAGATLAGGLLGCWYIKINNDYLHRRRELQREHEAMLAQLQARREASFREHEAGLRDIQEQRAAFLNKLERVLGMGKGPG
jgi:hypothetical protein